jgi:AcrR family transcriptional regulator
MTPRTRSRPLTREEVVDTALRIVDDEGLEALTMRRLGAALGVEAMALYRHVPNKEALLDLTVEQMRSEMHLTASPSENPAEAFGAIFAEYARVLAAHPNMLPLATRRTVPTSTSGLEYLIDQGLPEDVAVELYQSLTAFTIGWALLGATDSAWAGLPEHLARRLGRWDERTFRRTVGQLMAGYGFAANGERR